MDRLAVFPVTTHTLCVLLISDIIRSFKGLIDELANPFNLNDVIYD